jgi:predicted helicase
MRNEISGYITEISSIYKTGDATEHTYRPALQRLLENMLGAGVRVANEPKRIACGAPDYIITRGEIPVGYIEAKDIGADLTGKAHKEQFDRYRQSLDNLIITDYVKFRWYVRGEFQAETAIGAVTDTSIVADKSAFDRFTEIIRNFGRFQGEGIKTSEQLSKMMAAKARLLAKSIESALDEDERASDVSTLGGQLRGFREVLIPQITAKEFSDIYAQTIAYGMFAAKLNDAQSGEVFTRARAALLIPQSNPFLCKLFRYIAEYDLDVRISWMVDALADLFNSAYIPAIRGEFDKLEHDPMVHFYETFLAEYDPALRKSRGVWYTPRPVVQFIVRAVDDILKADFKLADGLADTSKTTPANQKTQTDGEMKPAQKSYHRVQILDPAAGTGTFLAEVVRRIYRRFEKDRGMWRSYVGEHLIPRLNGFEVLMASYAMAHLKLDMLLRETGYTPDADNRLHIFLTNSLSSAIDKTETPFVQWLSREANEASSIKKRDVPVMVVLGNPPYSVSSQNKGDWIENLIADYKKDLNERKLNLDDDYIKFIRYGQHYVEKNGDGILAYISNNSFIDGVTHRQMRKHLLDTFDKVYILDLHGSGKKKEKALDGGKDENVFDIMQGVSINIFVKTRPKSINKLAEVYHFDLYGKRAEKYEFLLNNTLKTVQWTRIENRAPFFFFVPKSENNREEYEKGFGITELFPIYNSGAKTDRDSLFIGDDRKALVNRIKTLLSGKFNNDFQQKYRVENSSSYELIEAIKGKQFNDSFIQRIEYRPFDRKWIYYSPELISRPAGKVMKHFVNCENVGLITCRQQSTFDFQHIFVSNIVSDICVVSLQTKETAYVFPLYLYPDKLYNGIKRKPNLNETIIDKISELIGLKFTKEKEEAKTTFAPIDVLDYIYAVLHSPTYRERYKEFLKIDFPRVPYPENAEKFRTLAETGAKLRCLHLMDGVEPQPGMADFPIDGSNEVESLKYASGRVHINGAQYFDRVPPEVWNFYIGGYQPAQKWLKDRKGRTLSYDDILHYKRIICVLKETSEIMRELA